MKKLFQSVTLILLWLVLCVLFLTGCHATAPAEAVAELGTLTDPTERTLLESLYLFVGTDYGEFCALVACAMAAHLILLIKQYLYPWLLDKAPRLAQRLKALVQSLLSFMKKGKIDNISLPNDLFPPFDENDDEDPLTEADVKTAIEARSTDDTEEAQDADASEVSGDTHV